MQFEFEETIPGPIDRVYDMLRDRLTDLVPYLEAIDSIEVLERDDDDDGQTKIVNLWKGNARLMPLMARPFVTKAMTKWKDHATWGERERTIEWWFEPAKFSSLFTCTGLTRLENLGDETTLFHIKGELDVYADRVPGVGKRMAKKLGPTIEKWAIKKVRPNLMQVPKALQSFFAEEEKVRRSSADSDATPDE